MREGKSPQEAGQPAKHFGLPVSLHSEFSQHVPPTASLVGIEHL